MNFLFILEHNFSILFFSDGIERNFSLTITNVRSEDEGDYNCVAINQGGMAEKNITLTFSHPTTWPGEFSFFILNFFI